jgi:hypothetical protein
MPDETLHVYVSSTWIDMQAERAAVLEVTSRLRGLSFLGMEFFGSRDGSTARTSVQEVDRADIYVGIIGHRYGSGITEQEYLRAHERGVPAFIYLKKDAEITRGAFTEDDAALRKLNDFRTRLLHHHTCSEFVEAHDLAVKLTADLHNWMIERHLARGLSRLSTDYMSRVQAFIAEYVGAHGMRVPFGGRDEELRQLDQWLDDPVAPRFLLVAAGAGKGKSALLVQWMRTLLTREDIAPVFFPVSIRFRTNLASVVFPCLATCLAALHDELLKITPDTPPEVWRGLLSDLLARPLRDGRRLVLIVDGLDEAADWSAGADLFPPHVSRSAHVVVAARFLAGDVDAADWRRRLGWETASVARTLTLSPLRLPGVAEVLDRMGFPLAALGERTEIVHELYRLSEGEPLIVRLYVDDLWARGDAVARLQVQDLRSIEPGLGGFFARWWDDQRRLWGPSHPLQERRVQALMNFLACALGPLTRDDLFALARPLVELNTWTLEEALQPIQRFIVGDGVESGYVYSHPGLAMHFRDRLSRSERELLDNRIIAWCTEAIQPITAGQQDPGELSAYVLQYFGAHLERLAADIGQFAPVLSDAWRRAWFARDGSYTGYRADLRRVQLAAARQAVNSANTAESLVIEVHTALCLASVDQLSDNTPPELVVALVQKGVWSRAGALGYARLIRDPVRRAKALINLASFVPDQTRTLVLHEVLETIALVPDETRVSLLGRLANQLPIQLVGDALNLALAIDKRALMVDAVVSLAACLTPSHLERTIIAVSRISDLDLRRRVFTALARQHPEALESWTGLVDLDPWEQAWILVHVADGIGAVKGKPVLDRAVGVATLVTNEAARLDLLVAIAERSEPTERAQYVDHVRRALPALSHAFTQATMLLRLAPLVERRMLSQIVRAALEACARITLDEGRAEVIAALAPHLRDEGADDALELTSGIGDTALRASASAALFPYLSATNRQWALEQILSVDDPFERLSLAAAIIEHVPEPEIVAAVAELRWCSIGPLSRFRLLQSFAPRIRWNLEDLLSDDVDPLGDLAQCAAVAGCCAAELRMTIDARVIQIVASNHGACEFTGDRFDEAVSFLVHWAADASDESLVRLTDRILEWSAIQSKLAVLDSLSPHLPAEILETAVRRLQMLGDDDVRRATQMRCLALMPPDLVIGGRLRHQWDRAAAADRVAQLLQWLQDDRGDTSALRREVVRLLPAIERGSSRADAIVTFMRHVAATVTHDELAVLIDAAISLHEPLSRTSTMSWLVPHIQTEDLTLFAEIFDAIVYDHSEAAEAAVSVASRVRPEIFLPIFDNIFSAELRSDTWDAYERGSRLRGLARVARLLDEPLRSAATECMTAAIEAAGTTKKHATLVQFGRSLEADSDFLDRCFGLAGTLPPGERIEAGLQLVRKLSSHMLTTAVRQLVSWVAEHLSPSDQARTIGAWVFTRYETNPAYTLASTGAWRAAVVIECLPTLGLSRSEELVALAYDDLRAREVDAVTTTACAVLLPSCSGQVKDALVGLALEGIAHLPDATAQGDALRALGKAASLDSAEPDSVATLAPYVDGERRDRFAALVRVTNDAGDDLAALISDLSARMSRESVLQAFTDVCSTELRSDPWDAHRIARRLSTVIDLACRIDAAVCAALLDHVAANLVTDDSTRTHDVLTALGGLLTADEDVFEYFFGIARRLPADERIAASIPFLRGLHVHSLETAVREVISAAEVIASPSRRARAVAEGVQSQLASQVASSGGWRAALVLECVPALVAATGASAARTDGERVQSTDVPPALDALIALAYDELRGCRDIYATSSACIALLPVASAKLQGALVELALKRIRDLSSLTSKASALDDIAAHAPAGSTDLVVAEIVDLIEEAEGERGTSVTIATVLGKLLSHATAGHASELLDAALKHGLPYAVTHALVEHLPESALLHFAPAVAALIARQTGTERTTLVGLWISRLPQEGFETLPDVVRASMSPAGVALALSHALPRVPAHAKARFKSLALEAITADPSVQWADLVSVQRAAGGEPWPELGSLIVAALKRETSPHQVMHRASAVLPILTGQIRSDVAAQALAALAATISEGVSGRDLSATIPPDDVGRLLEKAIAARRPAERCVVLLPFVRPAQRKALVHVITQLPGWLDDAHLLDAVSKYLEEPEVAQVLADRVIGHVPAVSRRSTGDPLNEHALELWAGMPPRSPAWHPMFVFFVFSAATRSRAHVMRLLQQTIPTVQSALGPGPVEKIIDSLESVGEWWP